MTIPTNTNIAEGNAHVDVQAGVVHNVNFYEVPPDASPERRFRAGVNYLDNRVRDEALSLIEGAVAEGHVTTEVQFYRLLALLSGRTLRQLSTEDLDRLEAICTGLPHLDDRDEWAAGVKAIIRLLTPTKATEPDLVIKHIDVLGRRQRELIYGHLEALLEGTVQDEMWHRSVALAVAQRTAHHRRDRVWKFFHPEPARPRVRAVRPATVALREWLLAGTSASLFTLAVVKLAELVGSRGDLDPVLGLLAALGGLAAFWAGAADRHFRRERRRAKDAELLAPRQRRSEAPASGFAGKVDRLFNRYFRRYVPRGTDRAYWIAQTAGIRRQLRDEMVELYREQRIPAERIAWLVRHLVGDVKQRWEQDTLTAYRQELRVPGRSIVLQIGGLALVAVGSFYAVPAALASSPISGGGWLLLAVASAVPAARSTFRIVAERRRVTADEAERFVEEMARWAAYRRWQRKLADKPTDTEMAAWLEGDRKVLVDRAIQQYRLRPSHVIAHAFIEAPASSCKKARYHRGPWRYSRYQLLLFLLTDDGVRQVDIDLDFKAVTDQTTQRLNYRFDAVAAVRIDGIATQRQTFELTLVNGEPLSVRVSDPDSESEPHTDDPTKVTELSLDASGLPHTLHVLEGVAAEGKEWVKHRRRRADARLAKLSKTTRDLID
ncbi:hypothetical protein [Micromonospora mirobrigensis]|uniref:Uncharacterized protein n=1 Tax=Micromonospora mirobrigensis TaxID=262898 RepID=A0A1C4WTD9_9ACTN|nr:hypothetical protein [Micromonospora mirobrigensis]SCE99482.1 hypothetical protein GA0070564_102495 [Micromonospora mirobrigensis]